MKVAQTPSHLSSPKSRPHRLEAIYSKHRDFALGRQIMFIISAIVLCIMVPLYLHDGTGGLNNARSPWWSICIMVLSGASFSWVLSSSRRHLFAMVLWLFTYIFMGMASYVQYRLWTVPGTVPEADLNLFPAAGLLVLACSIATLVGTLIASFKPAAYTMRQSEIARNRAHMLTGFGFILFAYFSSKVGIGAFLLSRREFGSLRAQVWPNSAQAELLMSGLNVVLLVGFLAQMAVYHQDKAAGRSAAPLMPLLNALVLLYAVNPISTSRTFVGTVYLAMLAAFGAYATVKRFRIVSAGAVFGMLTIFPLADVFRASTDATVEVNNVVNELSSADFDAYAQLATTFDYVTTRGYTYGEQLLGALLFWVPRVVWPGKPVATGTLLGEHMNYRFTNLSSPIWSEFLIDFGWLGAVLCMGLLGYVFQRWDLSTDLYLRTSRVPPILICAIAFYMLGVLRGSLLSVGSYIPVIVLAAWFVTKRRKHGGHANLKQASTSGYRKQYVHDGAPHTSSLASRPTSGRHAGGALSLMHGEDLSARPH